MAWTLRIKCGWTALPVILASLCGCYSSAAHLGSRHVTMTDVCEVPSGQTVQQCGPTCSHPPGQPCPNITINMPKELRLKTEQPEQPAAPAGQPAANMAQAAAISRETLLVPRMVYVPYAPQVPVAPARMVMTQPAGTMSMVNMGYAPPSGAAEPSVAPAGAANCPPQVTAEQFLRLAEAVEVLAKRVNSLPAVQYQQAPMPATVPCPTEIECPPNTGSH